jgi:UPF0755 protein
MKAISKVFILFLMLTFSACAHLGYSGTNIMVSIRPGERITDVAARLEKSNVTTRRALLAVAAGQNFNEYWFVPPPAKTLSRFEGLFRPGTLAFTRNELPVPALAADPEKQAVKNALYILQRLFTVSAAALGSVKPADQLSPYQQLILASMVEKEDVSGKNYELVASVFLNRLKWGDCLASCPTVEYALGYHRAFLTRHDISIPSPYNVYLRKGLPPTPICFFSDKALQAVRRARESAYYFFVLDWTTDRLYFARTYPEHQENIKLARANYIRKFGYKKLYQIRYDKFYEE